MLQEEGKGRVDCNIFRPLGSAGKLQGVREQVGDGFESGPVVQKTQGDGPLAIQSCDTSFFGERDDVKVLRQDAMMSVDLNTICIQWC